MATKDAVIRGRIERSIKEKAEKIFERLGLTQSDALNIFYRQVILNKGLPFNVKIPNKTTRAALKEDLSKAKAYDNLDDFWADVGA